MLDAAELGQRIRTFTATAFRLETLAWYDVASDWNDFDRWRAGEPGPTPERKQPWLTRLRSEVEQGLYRHRVHIVTPPISDYLRYEAEWSYVPNSQVGEDIRILDTSERALPAAVADHDFWLLDSDTDHAAVLRMFYDAAGRFIGAEEADAAELNDYRTARDAAWSAAEPFNSWWARHPEYHRSRAA
jgi:hypothetical protein